MFYWNISYYLFLCEGCLLSATSHCTIFAPFSLNQISELVHGQPTRVQVFECLTCRGVGGAGGRLHLVCDTCRRVNHAARGHRVRPLGTAFECDDSACVSPWCPEFRVRTLLPASKDAANASSGLTNSSINSSSSGSVDKPSDGDQSRANGSNSSGGVQTSRLFSAARGEGFDAAITPPSTAASAAGTSGAIPSPHDEASAMLRMIAPLLDGSKIEVFALLLLSRGIRRT